MPNNALQGPSACAAMRKLPICLIARTFTITAWPAMRITSSRSAKNKARGCGRHRDAPPSRDPVGAELARECGVSATSDVSGLPPSRASSLPQWFYVQTGICGKHQTCGSRACSRMRCISHQCCIRAAAFASKLAPTVVLCSDRNLRQTPNLWEPSLLANAVYQPPVLYHGCRLREQARSHSGSMLRPESAANTKPVGAELARECGVSATSDVSGLTPSRARWIATPVALRQPIQRQDQSTFARPGLWRTMDQAETFVARPALAFEQRHVTLVDLLDQRSILRLALGAAQLGTVDRALLEPLATDAGIGGDQPHRYVIDMKARAHGFIQHPQPQTDAFGAQQASVGADQPGHVGHEAVIALQVREARGQAPQIRFFVVLDVQGHGLGQRLAQRQQQRAEVFNVRRQLALPDRQVYPVFQHIAEHLR